jgi:transposase
MKQVLQNPQTAPVPREVLESKVAALEKEIAIWREKYNLLKLQKYGRSTEKNISQGELFDECDAPATEEENIPKDTITVPEHTRAVKPKRQALPEDLPRNTIIHDVEPAEKVCGCGCQKTCFGEEVTEQLEVVPAKVSVTRHVRPKYSCPQCKQGVVIAPMPLLLLPKSMAAASLVAQIIVSKYVDHMPLYRQEQMFKRINITLPRNTVCNWVMKTAELCEPLWWCLKKALLRYDYIQADETRMQVLNEPDRKNTSQSYIWAYRGGPPNKRIIIYDYQPTRSGKHAAEFLHGFKGYLQTDGYAGYDWVDKTPDITHLACMAHARRPFAELVKLAKQTGKAHQAVALIGKLYQIEKKARDENLTPSQRFALRQEYAQPILEKIKAWLDKSLGKTPPKSKLGSAIAYMLKRWQELTNYLADGQLEIDNNGIENAIRPFTLGRKNWIFGGSPRGAEASATLYSLLLTCKANNIEPSAYLNAMLPKLRACQNEADYAALLPFNINL